ncbi:hypothetical protein BGX24_000287 [Mortierella sp. AD032]|nr:hypothetical protein BGX24_000287 [Mortierella sp. AD032]
MNLASSPDLSSASRPQQQQQHQKLHQGEGDKAAAEVGGRDADEITAPGHLTTSTVTTTTAAAAAAAVAEIDNGDVEEVGSNDSADALVELDHDNVAQRRLQGDDEGEDEDEDEEDEDWEGTLRRGGGGGGSPVTPRSQFGRWKYSIMMSQSTMRPPKLSQEDDAVAVKRSANGEDGGEGGGGSEEDDDGDTHWPFGDADIGSDPSTPKRRPSKIPRDFLMSPTSPSFRDSGCDDNDVDEEEEEEEVVEEEEEDNGTGADQDAHTTKDESQILKSFTSSQQDRDTGIGHTNDNGTGNSSSTSAIGQGLSMKPPKLNLKHLGGGLPLSPSEISSSFHTPPRKRTRKDLDDFGTVGRPPPAPKLISPEQILQFFSSSQSPSVLKSLQLRRMDGSLPKRPSNER